MKDPQKRIKMKSNLKNTLIVHTRILHMLKIQLILYIQLDFQSVYLFWMLSTQISYA